MDRQGCTGMYLITAEFSNISNSANTIIKSITKSRCSYRTRSRLLGCIPGVSSDDRHDDRLQESAS